MTDVLASPASAAADVAQPVAPMRILHVINMGTTCGGAERLVADVAAAQRRIGHTVRVLSSDSPGAGVPFSDVTWSQNQGTGIADRIGRLLRNTPAREALAAAVHGWQPDVVHLHTIGMLAPSALRVLAETPTVLTLHGPEVFLRGSERWCLPDRYFRRESSDKLNWRGALAARLQIGLVGRWWRRELQVVDVFVTPSHYLASLSSHDFAVTRVVANGFAAPVTATAPPPADRAGPTVLFAGRLERVKGPQVLIDAVPQILQGHPDARFVICGTGSIEDQLRRRVAELGVGHAVTLAGWLEPREISRRIATADVVVVPSVWPEAFGLSCLEAFGAGRPVVASAIGALPELVEPEVTGLLVPPSDPAALAASVSRMLGDAQLRRETGEGGRRVSAAYGIDAHRDGLSDVYAEAISRAARPAPPRGRLGRVTTALRDRARTALNDSLVRNSALLLLATMVLAAGGFFFWQVAAHLFTPDQVGQAGALISISTLLANLALLGMHNSLIKYLGHWPDPARTINTGVAIVTCAAILASVACIVGLPIFVPSLATGLRGGEAVGFVLLTVAGTLSLLYDNVFIAIRRCGHILARNALVTLLRMGLLLLLIGLGAYGIVGAYWGAFAVALVPYLIALRRHSPLRATASLRRLRTMWAYSMGTYTATIILMLPAMLTPTIVAQRAGLQSTGFYYVCSLLAGVLMFIPLATARSLFAEASHDAATLRRELPRVLWMTAVAQTPIALLLIAAGRPLLRLYGDGYTDAYPLLILLVATNALSSIAFIGSTLLLISGQTRRLCILSGIAYAISVVGTYLVADRGLVWIGLALLAGEAVLALGYLWIIVGTLRVTGSGRTRLEARRP